MPIELDDPELVERLREAGVHSIHEPLVPLLADGTVDIDRTLAIAVQAKCPGVRSVPSRHANVIITQIAYGAPPTRFEPYVDDGVLGGYIPINPQVWAFCRGGRLAINTFQQFPDTMRDALGGRPLHQLIRLPAFDGRPYVLEACVMNGRITVGTCLVGTLPVEEAVGQALDARGAAGRAPAAAASTHPNEV